MNTPICDFVKTYGESGTLRLHMPGHKGVSRLGCEGLDITEIEGADVLYRSGGIIRQSEENAAALFGTARTVYSAEGSSLAIRGMLYLALQATGRRTILAGRNAHSAFITAAALLDADVRWLFAAGGGLTACPVTPSALETALDALPEPPAAVYVTSPDYLGNRLDIAALADVCHSRGVLLLVDNAHGAYLRFLPADSHPITLGADLCCDSAHKTLPVLTGGAYLHISDRAPALCRDQAKNALALFGSTSPSYLILQSLDRANAYLADGYREKLAALLPGAAALTDRLARAGWTILGEEPLKITAAPKSRGYRGHELADLLLEQDIVCEFADPDFLVLMLTPELTEAELLRLESVLNSLPARPAIAEVPPAIAPGQTVLSVREATLTPWETVPAEQALDRVLGAPSVGCPPAVPILVCGERIDAQALRSFRYYGIRTCTVTKE